MKIKNGEDFLALTRAYQDLLENDGVEKVLTIRATGNPAMLETVRAVLRAIRMFAEERGPVALALQTRVEPLTYFCNGCLQVDFDEAVASEALEAEVKRADAAEAKIERVRALHSAKPWTEQAGERTICAECVDGTGWPENWPCATIRALADDAEAK